ncbi:aconitate hydratase [Candidatus Magnetominusculus xianensis]|uniref:Aconitate hydratase A n=1 Tax=Candidatus Magnetominusculus xianensis TaxID=1748249 RepID=A0ABR5SEG2_9BACT|nr:aconitate hydratase [Candidatus Magnetominusculus xianensis]KWT84200.1 aconitate hydratase [Candidatus Magnetominusculus xianensis]MBF0405431.1 aconitate hydratase [Nitrospirota bacterium]
MSLNIVEKIFQSHLVYGEMSTGVPIGLNVDEVYTQDATGTMAWLQFEAIGIDKVKVPVAVSYVDHNMVQSNFMNPDDHAFLQSAAGRFGAYFSRPGNGICHQVNLERFAAPGKIALGTDSHTPTNGGAGMLAIGVGGLDAAVVMGGAPFELNMPMVTHIRLSGQLRKPYVTAMDIILEILRRLTVKGGVGRIFEYGGDGAASLDVTQRATITNMGAELGATTSIFPSDERTLEFLKAQGRQDSWIELKADEGAKYDEVIDLDLSTVEPMAAQPHSPDNVIPVRELAGTKVDQVCIGGCTNSSYQSMRAVAALLNGKTVAERVNLLINPGSRQVYEMIARDGSLVSLLAAGARVLESSCGPCIGMGGAPGSGQVSVRTFNRNFKGRSGTKDASVYLASPITCAIAAVTGEFTDILKSDVNIPAVDEPKVYPVCSNMIIPPSADNVQITQIIKGPNIKEVPVKSPLDGEINAEVLIKLGDNITTDDIMPAGSKVLPFRSNIPAISEFVFSNIDTGFVKRAEEAKSKGGGIIIGGENYGQGSSREHAALAPMFLGVQAVIAVSFARIHRSNLINFGILPLTFEDSGVVGKITVGDRLIIKGIRESVLSGQSCTVENATAGFQFTCASNLNSRERELILIGGLLPYTKAKSS